jgi:hypothetical protein
MKRYLEQKVKHGHIIKCFSVLGFELHMCGTIIDNKMFVFGLLLGDSTMIEAQLIQ